MKPKREEVTFADIRKVLRYLRKNKIRNIKGWIIVPPFCDLCKYRQRGLK